VVSLAQVTPKIRVYWNLLVSEGDKEKMVTHPPNLENRKRRERPRRRVAKQAIAKLT
jgi:hypothetical protein